MSDSDGTNCSSCTPHTRTTCPHHTPSQTAYTTTAPANVVFIVTDICYPKESDFASGRGIVTIDSVHSTKKAANARAKKIIFEAGPWHIDIDKIIEEVRNGLYTGIGVGGEDRPLDGHCYARKCEVESWTVDEDDDKESEEESASGEGDVDMG